MIEETFKTLRKNYDNLLYILFIIAFLFIYTSSISLMYKVVLIGYVGLVTMLTSSKDNVDKKETTSLAPPPPPENQQEENLTGWAK